MRVNNTSVISIISKRHLVSIISLRFGYYH
jgi:hypothetical protein